MDTETDLGIAEFATAVELAGVAHAGQRTVVGDPYILHPIRVALALRVASYDFTFQIVGVLHDVVEDTDVTLEQVRSCYGEEVARAVDAVTKREGETYQDFVMRATRDAIGGRVKLYDVRDNMGRLDELANHPDLQERLTRKYNGALSVLRQAGIA